LQNNSMLTVEIKNATSGISLKHISDFFVNKESITIQNISFFTSNLTYSLVHLFSNIYGNSELRTAMNEDRASLRDYLDIYTYIIKYGRKINWQEVWDICNSYQIIHKVFCVLNNSIQLFG